MKRAFVIGVSDLSTDQQSTLIEHFRQNGFGWWHWISETWFVLAPTNETTVNDIFDLFKERSPASNIVVMEIECKDWATRGPERNGKSFSSWFKRNFS